MGKKIKVQLEKDAPFMEVNVNEEVQAYVDMAMNATARNPANEARTRSMLMTGLMSAQMLAMFTKAQDDDRIVAFLMGAVTDPVRWERLAEALWGLA